MHLRARIDAFNRIAQSVAAARGFRYSDVSAISRQDNTATGWLAADGLHPGPAQHQAIANQLWTVLEDAWRRR
jgi:lysophospholipase L1-like esterase